MSTASSTASTTPAPTALQRAVERGAILLGDTIGLPGSDTVGLAGIALPSSDRGAAGVALGMALAGKVVILELPDSSRLTAIADLLAEAGRLAVAGAFQPKLIVRVPYGELPGTDQPLGHTMAPAPGVRMICPADAAQAHALLLGALDHTGVTVFLEARGQRPDRSDAAPIAPALREVRPGQHVTLAAWGHGVAACLAAAEALATEGISAQVIDLVQVEPVDGPALAAHIRRTGRLVVAHPHDDEFADAIRAAGLDGAFLHLESPLASAPARSEAIAQAARDAVFY